MIDNQKRIKLMAKIEVLEDTIQHYIGLKKNYGAGIAGVRANATTSGL